MRKGLKIVGTLTTRDVGVFRRSKAIANGSVIVMIVPACYGTVVPAFLRNINDHERGKPATPVCIYIDGGTIKVMLPLFHNNPFLLITWFRPPQLLLQRQVTPTINIASTTTATAATITTAAAATTTTAPSAIPTLLEMLTSWEHETGRGPGRLDKNKYEKKIIYLLHTLQ